MSIALEIQQRIQADAADALAGLVDADQIQWPGAPFDGGKAGATWCRVSVVTAPDSTVQADFGATPRARTAGILAVEMFRPVERGYAPLLEMADAVGDAVERQFTGGLVQYETASVVRIGRDPTHEQVNVSVPWWADEN